MTKKIIQERLDSMRWTSAQACMQPLREAHKEYLAHIYADRTPKDYERVKQALKKDLRHGRRWSILVDGFVADNGDSIPGLGLGLLLLCGPAVAKKKRKKSYAHTCKKNLIICITVITLQDTLILI